MGGGGEPLSVQGDRSSVKGFRYHGISQILVCGVSDARGDVNCDGVRGRGFKKKKKRKASFFISYKSALKCSGGKKIKKIKEGSDPADG